MPIYQMTKDAILPLPNISYAEYGVKEREDLQRLLKANMKVVDPDLLIISEEFADWTDSRRRIDLLGIDRDAKLVVIELKRNDGGHMELQAIRYAAMVSRMTFQRAVRVFEAYLQKTQVTADARAEIINHLRVSEPLNDESVLEVRILLIAADFAKELTTAVLWLNEWELDIRCVRIAPYQHGDELMLDIQQIVPLPEASEYIVSIREEAIDRREAASGRGESTGYWFMNTGEDRFGHRSWEDCRKYAFMSSGGSEKYQGYVRSLKVGDRVFAYLTGHGYVGLCEVIKEAVPEMEFKPLGQSKLLKDLPRMADGAKHPNLDPGGCEYYAAVKWIKALDRKDAVLRQRFRRPTAQVIKQPELVEELLRAFGISEQ